MRTGVFRTRLLSRLGAAGIVTTTVFAGLAVPVLAASPPGTTGAAVLYGEGFTGQDTPAGDWISKNTGGQYLPCLTAADKPTTGGIPECREVTSGAAKPDATGAGAFELTPNSRNESGFGLFTRPLQTDKGIKVDFDFFQYNAHLYDDGLGKRGGDGITFFLINGAASPASAGDTGGSLGYRNLPGAVIGLGFDEFGNFSTPKWGGSGGPGERPDSVVLRGADSTGYQYIAGERSPFPLAVDSATQRSTAKRHVTIELSTKNELSVYVNYYNGKGARRVIGPINLNTIKGQPPLPPTIKFGFAAATGDATAYHDIQGMTVTSLPPDLQLAVSHSGTFQAGGSGTFKLAVTNDPGAGPTTGPATVVFHVPDGLTPQTPQGDQWQCSVAGQVVTCSRPDTLNNGAAFPPITVPVTVAGSATGTLTATGVVSDPNDSGTTGKTVTDSITIGVPSPDLTLNVSHSGAFTPGGAGTYTIGVADKPGAGPTSGPTTVVFPVPDGMTLVSAGGSGWTCTTADATATCSRTDVLQPGTSYPPLAVNVTVAPGTTGQVPVTVTGSSPGDANPQSLTATDTVTVAPLPPDLSMAATANGPFKAGGTGTFTLTTSNAANAGPTTGTVTDTFTTPAGLTVQSAAGDGWQCSISGRTVSCTRPGSGADALEPGSSYPPVTIVVAIPATISGQGTATAVTGTTGDTGAPSQTVRVPVTIAPLAPAVTVAVTAPPVVAGDPATVTLVATDSPDAGPVTGSTSVSFTVPAGYTATSAAGPGWTCTIAAQKVTCTRSGPLQPGNSFPPVTITMTTPATASGTVPLTATGQTGGQPAAATASGTLTVKALAPKLLVTLGDQGEFRAGQSGAAYLITVGDDPAAGPVTGQVTVTFPAPGSPAMKPSSVTGDGWTCTVSAGTATCTRTSPLAPGGSYPVITVAMSVPPALSGSVPGTVTASTPGPDGPVTAQGNDTVSIGQLPPDVTVAVTPPAGGVQAGGSGSYTLVASDGAQAGPVIGPTTITFTANPPLTVTSAKGSGWVCSVAGQIVTCTRTSTLQPGASFPPVHVVVAVPATATNPVSTVTSVGTPGNASAAVGVATRTPVIPLAPDPVPSLGCLSTAADGSTAHVCVQVGDPSTAGPVTNPVTVWIPAPPGMTPGTATGSGWNCGDRNSVSGFVCVTSSAGGLDPGRAFAGIDTSWLVNGHLTGRVPVQATAYTAGDEQPDGDEATGWMDEAPAPANVVASTVSTGAAAAGGTVDVTVNVSDAAGSGAASAGTVVTVPMPNGLRPVSEYGNGWACAASGGTASGDAVSCHRSSRGTLLPGQSYPPITIADSVASPWPGGRLRAACSN
jgi:Bacterial lectin